MTKNSHKRKLGKLSHRHAPSHRSQDLLAKVYKQLKAGQHVAMGHMEQHMRPFESVRKVEYNGHHIIIRTQYQIKVDGKSLRGQIYVDNSGRVSTHAIPNYSFTSTVDLIKKLIDAFPANFPKASRKILTQQTRRK